MATGIDSRNLLRNKFGKITNAGIQQKSHENNFILSLALHNKENFNNILI